MAARPPVNPLQVDWSGENPGMYLKEREDGPYVTLVSFFRVVMSPHGRGHVLVLLEDPNATHHGGPKHNVCLHDNEALARWLVRAFVTHFGAFRGVPALNVVQYLPLARVETSGDAATTYVERITGSGLDVELTWGKLGTPFYVELPPDRSATGKHELFSLFADSMDARAVVDGRTLPGRSVSRDFHGRKSTSAFLAFSETWVKAG